VGDAVYPAPSVLSRVEATVDIKMPIFEIKQDRLIALQPTAFATTLSERAISTPAARQWR
jgi:hypothetical protein